jgi:hypothetical protein
VRVGDLLDDETGGRQSPQSIKLDEDTAVDEAEAKLMRVKLDFFSCSLRYLQQIATARMCTVPKLRGRLKTIELIRR